LFSLELRCVGFKRIKKDVRRRKTVFILRAWLQPNFHGTRWYEAGASRRAANWFDNNRGRLGVDEFVLGANVRREFDRNAFITGSSTVYRNQRSGGNNLGSGNPIQARFRVSDLFCPLALPFLIGLGILIF
jgi:hypothetical protein